MTAHIALSDCHSSEQVVALVNRATFYASEQLAAQYAYEAANEAGYGTGEAEIEAHLVFLRNAGAAFQFCTAMRIAAQLGIEAHPDILSNTGASFQFYMAMCIIEALSESETATTHNGDTK